jgi:lipoate-protein ligase A
MQTWRVLKSGYHSGYYNMAVDEAVFLGVKQGKSPPTLRIYGFDPPCLSLGFFQRISREINLDGCARLGIEVVRRITGGRAVLHWGDLTYSVIAEADGEVFSYQLLDTYRKISAAIAWGLDRVNVSAQLVSGKERGRGPGSANCFSSPSIYEVTVAGKKIAGSAQKREHSFFLQHGSILIDLPAQPLAEVFKRGPEFSRGSSTITSINEHAGAKIDFQTFQPALIAGFEQVLDIKLKEAGLSDHEQAQADRLMRERYMSAQWNCGRWPDDKG